MWYVVRVWCPDCLNEDPEGCFGGKMAVIVEREGDWEKEVKFKELEMAAAVGIHFTRDSIWEFTIFPVKEDGYPDLNNPVPDEKIDWSKAYRYAIELKDEIERQWDLYF